MAVDYSVLPLAKGRTRKAVKRERRADEVAVIKATRTRVWLRDAACRCGGCAPHANDEMNEVVPRSLTRGLDPTVRFSTKNCLRMSRTCHRAFTEHEVALRFATRKGADGRVEFWYRFSEGRECTACGRRGTVYYLWDKPLRPLRCRRCVEGENEAIVCR